MLLVHISLFFYSRYDLLEYMCISRTFSDTTRFTVVCLPSKYDFEDLNVFILAMDTNMNSLNVVAVVVLLLLFF